MFYSPALGIDNTAMPWRPPRWKGEAGQRRIPSFFFSFPILDFSEQIVQRCCSILWKLLDWRFTQKTIHSTEDGLVHWFHSDMGKQSPEARLSSLRNSERFPPRPKARMICIQCDVWWAIAQLRTGSIVTCYASPLLHASLLCRILYNIGHLIHWLFSMVETYHIFVFSWICLFFSMVETNTQISKYAILYNIDFFIRSLIPQKMWDGCSSCCDSNSNIKIEVDIHCILYKIYSI